MRFILGALAALLALAGAASAHYPGSDTWHDLGTDLGALGPNPADTPTGACWYSESQFPVHVTDVGPPPTAHDHLDDLNGHHWGLGAGCTDGSTADPTRFVRIGVSTSLLPGGGPNTIAVDLETGL